MYGHIPNVYTIIDHRILYVHTLRWVRYVLHHEIYLQASVEIFFPIYMHNKNSECKIINSFIFNELIAHLAPSIYHHIFSISADARKRELRSIAVM